MKVPPKRKGNSYPGRLEGYPPAPSMKVPPKRKGNPSRSVSRSRSSALNESPSEKEGKSIEAPGLKVTKVPQ